MDKTAFFNLSYGVYLCTTWDEGRPTGCVANSAMQVTSEPATIAVSLNHDNYTNRCVKECGHFSIVVLGEKCDPKLIGKFGFMSGRERDKFADTPYAVRGKLPVPNEGLCYFSCKVIESMETSTHTVFLGEVYDAGNLNRDTPMTYAYYHRVLKGKTAANAPTYLKEQEEAESAKPEEKWVCKVCGYVYDGEIPFEELPESWVCPICGVDKSNFEKQ